MTELDRTIHEPARLRILTLLSGVDKADFKFLLTTLSLTRGNLSSHMARLEDAGYVKVIKSFNGKVPHTEYRMTKVGQKAITEYWTSLDEIRTLNRS
jgi:DNA-binding transcriptional ArsR family regulator